MAEGEETQDNQLEQDPREKLLTELQEEFPKDFEARRENLAKKSLSELRVQQSLWRLYKNEPPTPSAGKKITQEQSGLDLRLGQEQQDSHDKASSNMVNHMRQRIAEVYPQEAKNRNIGAIDDTAALNRIWNELNGTQSPK